MAPHPSPPAADRVDRGLALGIALAAAGLYARTVAFPFLELDSTLRENPFWGRPLSGLGLGAAWRAGGLGGITLLLESAPGGDSAVLSRAVSVLLYAVCAALLFSCLRRLGVGRDASALCSALFALHPLGAEAVASLAQRSILLAGLCSLFGLWLSLRTPDRRRALLILSGTTLAALLIAGQPAPALPQELGLATRFLHAPRALGALVLCTLWPADLAWSAPHPALLGDPSALGLALGWLALVSFAALLWRLRTRCPLIAQGSAWFLALALPQVLFPTSAAGFSARWSFLANGGLVLALVLAAGALLDRLEVAAPVRVVLGALWVLVVAGLSGLRLSDWSSDRALAERALALDPDNYRAHDLLGQVCLAQGRLSEAAREFERALALRPGDAPALLHRGEIELRRALIPGQEVHRSEARRYLERSLEADPHGARGWERLGEVFQRAGEPHEARSALEEALALEPTRAAAQARLGMVQLELDDLDGALEAFERASRLRPDQPEGWCGQGIVRFQRNEFDAARQLFETALAQEPDHVESRTTLGRIREDLGDLAGAEREYRRAVGVNPDNVDALFELGALCERTERGDEALRLYEHLLAIRPAHVRANLGTARLFLERGEPERARAALEVVLRLNPEHEEAKLLLERLRTDFDERPGDDAR